MAGALDTEAGRAALGTLVAGLPGWQGTVYAGVPESLATAVGAYVAIADMDIQQHATGGYFQVLQDYLVVFCYRVKGAEATAEAQVAEFKDKFVRAFFADRTLNGVATNGQLIPGLAATPQYLAFAGVENRLYPVQVRLTQRETIPTS